MARVADQLIEELKNEIQSGVLSPGDQLEEAALAERFGVSRTPVREAVRSLVESGLLETRSRKGAFVRVLSIKELIDLFEVCAELEGMACRLASERLTDAHLKNLLEGLEACNRAVEKEDTEAYAAANLQFHTAIHKASENDRLIDQLADLSRTINPYRSMPYGIRGRLEQSFEEHVNIKDAVLAGNGAEADFLMRDHMMLQGQRLPLLLRAYGHE
ncbi:GntR family transcriptional regulator [Thalassospira sp. GO-4]|jgi:DNA-binding GntR family transcriptional regulator|uniref:GntR family transcriptional regulator n=2 Tax=Thalassospira TaxID=168934 RepID=A0A367WAG1_9PROT|nr:MULTISPECIES: GntR family transcriptional regulator [Thalassospira]MDG4719998.1 GntR family transcriptional regulator [Thalassospira sp. FZY0004]RCK38436.1 GntR family transcriptional regulator [Thalassospira profundimaris]URK17766.1 GntR family transcriptional regulator [Thalassospira sp. GO-4]